MRSFFGIGSRAAARRALVARGFIGASLASRSVRPWIELSARLESGLDADAADDAADDEDELALAQACAAAARVADTEIHRPEGAPDDTDSLHLPTRRKARIDGFDLDAEVAVHEHERDRLEYLCRYLLRPPLSLDRLKVLGSKLIALELERPGISSSRRACVPRET